MTIKKSKKIQNTKKVPPAIIKTTKQMQSGCIILRRNVIMKLKKGVALLLASAAMVSLAGCGGNSGGSGSSASNKSEGSG